MSKKWEIRRNRSRKVMLITLSLLAIGFVTLVGIIFWVSQHTQQFSMVGVEVQDGKTPIGCALWFNWTWVEVKISNSETQVDEVALPKQESEYLLITPRDETATVTFYDTAGNRKLYRMAVKGKCKVEIHEIYE